MKNEKFKLGLSKLALLAVVWFGIGLQLAAASETVVLNPIVVSGAEVHITQTGFSHVTNGTTTATIPLQTIAINSIESNNNLAAFLAQPLTLTASGYVFTTNLMIGITPFSFGQNAVVMTESQIPEPGGAGVAWEVLKIYMDARAQRLTVDQYIGGQLAGQFTTPVAFVPGQTYVLKLQRTNNNPAFNLLTIYSILQSYPVSPNTYSPYPDSNKISTLLFNETFSQMGLSTSNTYTYNNPFNVIFVGSYRSAAKFMSPTVTFS